MIEFEQTDIQPVFIGLGEIEPQESSVILKDFEQQAPDTGELRREHLVGFFDQAFDHFKTTGLNDEGASHNAWKEVTNFAMTRIFPHGHRGNDEVRSRQVLAEIDQAKEFIYEYLGNLREGILGSVRPRNERRRNVRSLSSYY